MSIRIVKPGVWDTVQDQGRSGFSKWGINVNGAMDSYAADVANALVGNDPQQAVLEMHFPAAEILFLKETMISITGADFSAALNGVAIVPWKTIIVPRQSILSFTQKNKGTRVYLGVAGGFAVPKWLGSSSTNLKSAVGGFDGRRLRKGDELEVWDDGVRSIQLAPRVFPWSVNTESAYQHHTVGLLPGNELAWLHTRSKEQITEIRFGVHSSSDRMATHLEHESFTFEKRSELFSSAVTFGTIQLLPSGKLIILMSDHQTTGGYPRVAHVISAHLPFLSQITVGETFRFRWVTSGEAEKMLFSLRTEMSKIRHSIRAKLNTYYAER